MRIVPERLDVNRAGFIEALKGEQVGCSVHFIPLHLHPLYQGRGYRLGDFPVAESIFARIVSLPIYPDLSDAEVDRVCAAVERVCSEHSL